MEGKMDQLSTKQRILEEALTLFAENILQSDIIFRVTKNDTFEVLHSYSDEIFVKI